MNRPFPRIDELTCNILRCLFFPQVFNKAALTVPTESNTVELGYRKCFLHAWLWICSTQTSTEAHQVTLVVKEASLKEQLGFSKLLCTNRCPHRQEGRPLSRGSSTGNHAGIKQKGQLFWGWSGNYFAMFNKTTSPECSCATMTILFPSNNPVLVRYFHTTSTLCQPPLRSH